MSTIKISQLANLPSIAANTSNTLFLGVDLPTGITGKFTATTLAQQLFSNNILNNSASISYKYLNPELNPDHPIIFFLVFVEFILGINLLVSTDVGIIMQLEL